MYRVADLFWATLLAGVIITTPVVSQESPTAPAATSLSLLHDILEPAAVSWWPPATIWYVIAGALLVFLIGWLVVRRQRLLANRYRVAALAELQVIRTNPREAAQGLSTLLKRVALVAWPRSKVAQQSGGSWWQFVDRDGGESFTEQHGKTLDRLSYGSREEELSDEEVRSAAAAVEDWIHHHHGERER